MSSLFNGSAFDAVLDQYFSPFAEWLASIVFYPLPMFGTEAPIIVLWLIVAGTFFTLWLKFLNVRGMKHAVNLIRGKYTPAEAVGEVSHFQALATAVSSTVGLGNIAGVAVAITLGGPGAAFWMVVAGFFGMSTKMVECTLAVKYRHVHADGTTSGGPMYYLRDGLAEVGFARLGKFLAIAWALFMMIAALGTNAFQANQATQQLVDVADVAWLADNKWAIGVAMAALTALVILGGIKSIARVTGVLVPFMAVLYVTACLIVIFTNIGGVPAALGEIITGAFSPEGVAGGVVGSLVVGLQRATFSNSAGVGDAAVAHSAVKTNRPASEGFVASLEPFIDTIIVCSMTALTIVLTGTWQGSDVLEVSGVTLTSRAFETVSPWFPYVLALAVLLFAYSTILSNSYYGMKGFGFLLGDNPRAEVVYKAIFLCFTVIGAASTLAPVILFADSVFFLLALCNIIGLYFLAKVVRREFHSYWTKLKAGEFKIVKNDRRPHMYGSKNP
ncbi:alanine glycine permease [Halomonas heilongjiangensis]|uniref:Alanine glycine permease n=2 Tax=Halomonas heilongjiangensis TaxID=1387883 RepID=A0A2N7TG27_9GAMM|nr:alanine glycine permease [Halomonas heilongjiangensis]PXX87881.1 alanine glycine permease [Halomonas heilongjiangensis]